MPLLYCGAFNVTLKLCAERCKQEKVKKTAKSFEEGVDLSVDSLERVIVKRKEKLRAHS